MRRPRLLPAANFADERSRYDACGDQHIRVAVGRVVLTGEVVQVLDRLQAQPRIGARIVLVKIVDRDALQLLEEPLAVPPSAARGSCRDCRWPPLRLRSWMIAILVR